MTNALASRSSGSNVVRLKPNRNLEQHMQQLNKTKSELQHLDNNLRKFLGLEIGYGHTIFARLFGWMVPRKLYGVIPNRILKLVAEEASVLEQIEGLMRECINNNQQAVANLANCALVEVGEVEKLLSDIEIADREGWNARQLQEYMANESQIEINPAISSLLDEKFDVLTDEQKKTRRSELLKQLKALALTRRKLITTLGNTCDAEIAQLNAIIGQFYDYNKVYRPIAVIHESAKGMLDTDRSIYAAREALMAAVEVSVRAVENIIKNAKAVNEYQISSAEFHQLLDASNRRLDAGLADLRQLGAGKSQPALAGVIESGDSSQKSK